MMSLRKRRTEFIPLLSKDDNPKIKQQLKRNEFRSTAGPGQHGLCRSMNFMPCESISGTCRTGGRMAVRTL
jgi:hypothetical protein